MSPNLKALKFFAALAFLLAASGFAAQSIPSPPPGSMVLGFAGPARQDGTHAMVQVSLVAVESLGPRETPLTLAEFADKMIAGVARRKDDWTLEKTEADLGGIAVVRYAWSGIPLPSKEVREFTPIHMRGVMYVGLDKGIGFALHSQDIEVYAKDALPIGEKSLRTFRLGSKDAK